MYARVGFGHLVRRHLYLGDLGYHSNPHVVDAQGFVSRDLVENENRGCGEVILVHTQLQVLTAWGDSSAAKKPI